MSAPSAWADEASPLPGQALLAQGDTRHIQFNIPPQALDSALTSLADQAGLRILFASRDVAGRTTPGLNASLTSTDALQQLLAGSGLSWRFTDPRTIAVERVTGPSGVTILAPVAVVENVVPPQAMIDNLPPPYPGGQVARGGQLGILGERDIMDTPFNMTSYTAQTMQDQQARSLGDVVANDPSVRNAWSASSYTVPLMVRGFAVSNQDVAFNGLYGIAPALTVTPEYLERVEVLKGPSALLNGMAPFGSIGGNINAVPKRASDVPVTQMTASYFSDSQFGGNIDFGRRFGKDDQLGLRINGVYRDGDLAVENQSQEVAAIVAGADFRGERLRLSGDIGYQKQDFDSPLRPTYVNAGVAVPSVPKATSNWFQPWSDANSRDTFGMARAEFDVTPDWTAYGAFGARTNDFDGLTGFARVTNGVNGNLTDAPFNFTQYTNSYTEEVGVRGGGDTGPINHKLTLAGTGFHLESGALFPTIVTIQSNLYNPNYIAKPNNIPDLDPQKTSQTGLYSLALADTLSALDEQIQVTAGLRQQRVLVKNWASATGAQTTSYDQSALTPLVGAVVKPWENISLYGNFIQGLQQGPTAPVGTTNAGQVFAPFVSTQYEVGAKADFVEFSTTVSFFQISQPLGITDPGTLTFSTDGEQRNRGIEINTFGEPVQGVRLLGGLMLLNGELTKTAGGLSDGKTAPGVPDVQMNIGSEWDLPYLRGLTLSGRVIYTDGQYLDVANTQAIPSWTRFDIGARYTTEIQGHKTVVRFNIEDLVGQSYWASANSAFGLAPGAPRTFLVSVTADF